MYIPNYYIFIALTYMPPQPTSTSSVMLATSTATPEPSMSPTTTEESDGEQYSAHLQQYNIIGYFL